VAFQFKRANCVAVGTFNMYIIQPAWLAEVDIIPKGIPVEIYSKLDEPGFRFTSPKMPTRWIVTPSRIQVESDRPDEDCGGAMARVFEQLPWTPLVALGNNTIYRASLDELAHLRLFASLKQDPPTGFEFAQKTVHYGLKRGETVFNLMLALTEDELEVSVNAHTELQGHKSDEAQLVARRFLQDRETAEVLIDELFDASVNYAKPDHPSPEKTDRGNGDR
jgi:hypothetical protein